MLKVNGHGSVSPQTKEVIYDAEYGDLPSMENADGFVFGGWYLDQGCSDDNKVVNTTIVATADNHTLFAK